MIDPESFYPSHDEPSKSARSRMWLSIESQIAPGAKTWLILERRSFILGMAATLVVWLAGFGAWTVAERLFDKSRPAALRVDHAYQAAIREFEALAPDAMKTTIVGLQDNQEPRREIIRSRQDQLRSIDEGISALRAELRAGDVSPLKQSKLRDLYAKKLVVLQDMIEQGDIAL